MDRSAETYNVEETNMSMINQEISDFRTYSYHKKEFKFVTHRHENPGYTILHHVP